MKGPEFEEVTVRRIKAEDLVDPIVLSKLLPMTYPAYRHFLSKHESWPNILTTACLAGGIPVAMALGIPINGDTEIALLSVFTARAHRGRGLGHKVVTQFIASALDTWCPATRVTAVFEEGREFSVPVNRILDKAGFGPSVPRCTVFRCDSDIAEMPWLGVYFDLPSPFAMVDWANVPIGAIAALVEAHAASPVYPEHLSPLKDSEIIEPSNSLALMREEKLVGWSMTHRPLPDTIRYSSIFVTAEYRGFGLAIPLLMESIRRHVLTPMAQKVPNATFVVYHDNQEMLRMVRKRMSMYAKSKNVSVERCLLLR